MKEGWLWHVVFSYLPPHDLVACSRVSLEFCALSRADKAWERHKGRVLYYCPRLADIFNAHCQQSDGKRVFREIIPEWEAQQKRRKVILTPQGTWYIFVKYLMRNPFKMAFERREGNVAPLITNAVVEATLLVLFPREVSYRADVLDTHRVKRRSVCNKYRSGFLHVWFGIDDWRENKINNTVRFKLDYSSNLLEIYIRRAPGLSHVSHMFTGDIESVFINIIHDRGSEAIEENRLVMCQLISGTEKNNFFSP